jgi:hypothetical protein
MIYNPYVYHVKIFQEKAMETIKHKEERRKQPKPEEQEGMPPHQHCPPYIHRYLIGELIWGNRVVVLE